MGVLRPPGASLTMENLMPKFEIKSVDMTNYGEFLCGTPEGKFCLKRKVIMGLNEVTLKEKFLCGKSRQRRPYAQLTHVSVESCCKLYMFSLCVCGW